MHALLALYVYPTHTLFLGPLEFIADTGASLLEYFLSKLEYFLRKLLKLFSSRSPFCDTADAAALRSISVNKRCIPHFMQGPL